MATLGSTLQVGIAPDAAARTSSNGAVRAWLFIMAGLVLAMVMVGGATRLTGSGLSITEWQPIIGTLPPLSDAAWSEAFQKYQQIPQYTSLNKGMSLDAFKSIYWWEWAHRLLGRGLGVAFLVPFIWFVAHGRVTGTLAWKLSGLFILGGLQGALGWFMVKSGLSLRTDVSHYRLAAHLLMASALFAALLWTALDIGAKRQQRIRLKTLAAGSVGVARVIVALVFVQIGAGALVAGLKAGLAYDTWPLMDGHLIPSGLLIMQPWWENAFENTATVHFDHRILAYGLSALIAAQTLRVMASADDERMRRSAGFLLAVVACQVGLGILTVLWHVPLHLALTHQATAMFVLAAAVWHLHTLVRNS